ncbi:C2 domain-containing protein 5 [Rhipicephalus sanguineus]|uniref:C2 domain-containing protein 5 n=1 Tax=Rhipicephalus sanguineus TaxID=34632 RepID=UPI0018956811|nr:C2 domain-containing protein 5 [Rhipicephalus sanguineus]XP_037506508.1 C2 domain-containing protein 5 [Rhipicephalus sanguineus]
MPGKVRVKLLAARSLPIMDRASEACDAFGEVKLGNTCFKTEICKKSLNPQWNSDWFRFEVDDEELQDEPLQIRIMDYDTYSANDAIGKVYIDLNPLLGKDVGSTLSGWLPIYDTMHGIRGEVNLVVRIDLFSDSNRYRESSCGVRFFYSSGIPQGYHAHAILGFVEELVVNDDPEYKWIDKIRTPRASNEARQTLFSKLSGEVQRRIGHKALELGGNTVVAYRQCFDLEGESGVVVRGIGTAVTLVRIGHPLTLSPLKETIRESPSEESPPHPLPSPPRMTPVAAFSSIPLQRASDPDLHAGVPAAAALSASSGSSTGGGPRQFINRPALARESLDMLEYPFITMKQFPQGFIQSIGGVVSARSVKLLDQINNPDEPETRDAWWMELRKEIRSHTRSLGCNVVLGYNETTNICDEVVILSASGTAVLLNPVVDREMGTAPTARHSVVPAPSNTDKEKSARSTDTGSKPAGDSLDDATSKLDCRLCHIPYNEASVPFQAQLVKCGVCRRAKVPDVLFTTIEPPAGMPIVGKSCLIQARVCRNKKDLKGEQNAREISDSLPFLEIELHRQIQTKLKLKNLNGIFGLKVQVAIGERLIAGIATGTGAYLTAIPLPSLPIPKLLSRRQDQTASKQNGKSTGDSDTSDDERVTFDKSHTGKYDACVVELDDTEDAVNILREPHMPEGFAMCNTEVMPGMDGFSCNLQLFMQTYRAKLFPGIHPSRILSQHFDHIIQSLFVKLRKLVPCCLASLSFHIELPDQDELQVAVVGTAVSLDDCAAEAEVIAKPKPVSASTEAEQELIFRMDEEKHTDQAPPLSQKQTRFPRLSNLRYQELCCGRHGVDLTSLDHMPGGKIEKYLGNLDFFFIREGTSIREEGGLNGFVQGFMTEILAIVRAHVASLGGNAVVAFQMTQCVLLHNPHKNQGQCLINVAGDAVLIHYHSQIPDAETSENTLSPC